MMGEYILAIDQSTTTTKAILFDRRSNVVERRDVMHKQISPRQGWVEHDPTEIWHNIVEAIRQVIEKSGVAKRDIAFIAVTNQRETTMMWTAEGGPVYNAIVWQCSRADYIVRRPEIQQHSDYITEATGLQVSPYFSAAKACWIKENTPAQTGLMFGTMDSWVIWNLTGRHVTDYSNASRTQLFNIRELKWDEKLLEIFGLQDVQMPEVRFSDEIYGYTTVDGIFDEPIPVAGDMGDSHVGLQARLMSQALRKLTSTISKTNTCCIFINQLRDKIGVMFGNPETTTGGNALKFYSSVRLDIRKIGPIKDGEEILGNHTRVKVVKNKVAPPFRKAEFDIMYGEGISLSGEIVDLGVECNVIKKSGSWFSYGENKLGQGRETVKQLIMDNPELAEELKQKIVATFNGKTDEPELAESANEETDN